MRLRSWPRLIEKMRSGERQTLVIGMGHGTCTCEGAAFEYAFNVEHALREAGVRDLADLYYLTNENELGDFGVGRHDFTRGGFETTSKLWTESLFRERGIKAIAGPMSRRSSRTRSPTSSSTASENMLEFDFAMLLPPFTGVGLQAFDRAGTRSPTSCSRPNEFMKVDADYTPKPYEDWKPEDWPKTYESPSYPQRLRRRDRVRAAPPDLEPRKTEDGMVIAPAPPRTGMPSGIMGKTVALTIADRIKRGDTAPAHPRRWLPMGAACVASTGAGLRRGTAAAMTMQPDRPGLRRYPTGRDIGPPGARSAWPGTG